MSIVTFDNLTRFKNKNDSTYVKKTDQLITSQYSDTSVTKPKLSTEIQNWMSNVDSFLLKSIDGDWGSIATAISKGLGPSYYPVGSQFLLNHSLYSTGILFDVVHHITPDNQVKDITLPEGAEYGMVLHMHDVIYSTAFDSVEALYEQEGDSPLPAGTYHVKITRQPWFTDDLNKTFQFTLPQDLPVGGQLVWDTYNATRNGRTLYAYADANTTTRLFTCTISEGSSGSELPANNVNYFDRTVLGNNNWNDSDIRQWLNATASNWNVKMNKWDRPSSYASRSPFLGGFDQDFQDAILPVTLANYTNNLFDSTYGAKAQYSTVDKFFFPVNQNVNLAVETFDIGSVYDYYKGAANVDRIKYDITSDTTARYYWLRCPYPSYAYGVRNVSTSGALSSNSAVGGYGASAACVIGAIATN